MTWYNSAFAYKKAIVVPHANVSGGSDLPDFPLLVEVTSPDLKTTVYGGLVCSPLGFDLLFTDGLERRELAYELESYSDSTGALLCWVRIPRLSISQDTTIYLYFGNPLVGASLASPIAVWDSYYTSVWHMGNGVALNAYDSVTYNVGSPQTATATSGQIGGAASFIGNETVQSLNTGGLDMSSTSALILYGSATHDTTLTNACDMATQAGGTETSATTTVTGANVYAEVQSQGGTVGSSASIPGTPTGKGWVYQPGAGTFQPGNWSATVTLAAAHWGGAGTTDVTMRFFQYSGGVYTSIGTINTAITGTAKTTYSFNATAMSSVTFGAADLVYIDLWWHDTSQNADNPIVYVSSSSALGVDSDMMVATANFTPQGASGPTLTLSAWAKRAQTGTWQTLIEHGSGTQRDYDLVFTGPSSNVPANATLLLGQDTFAGRSASNGWGTGTDGHLWTLQAGTASGLSVSSNEGRQTIGAGTCELSYGTGITRDVDLLIRFSLGGAADTLAVEGRASYTGGTTSYRLALQTLNMAIQNVSAGSAVTLVNTALSLSTSTFYWVRFRLQGTTLSARYWQDGTAEPTTWLLSTTDTSIQVAGQYGVYDSSVSGNLLVDHFSASGFVNADTLAFLYRDPADSSWQCYASTAPYTDTASWHHYALTYTYGTPSSAILYVDGQPITASWTSGTGTMTPYPSYDVFSLGTRSDTLDPFAGSIDEVHVSKGIARSAGWLATEYSNQFAPLTFIRAGETIPFEKNVDVPLLVAYGVTTAQTSAQQINSHAQGVVLVVTPLQIQPDDQFIVTLTGTDEISGSLETLGSWTASSLGPNAFTLYPGVTASSTATDDVLPRIWQVNVSPTTNEATSFVVSASLIV